MKMLNLKMQWQNSLSKNYNLYYMNIKKTFIWFSEYNNLILIIYFDKINKSVEILELDY